MADMILDNKSYIKLLKSIRSAAAEKNGKLDYTELKTFFEGIALTPKQAENLWIFLDTNCIMIMHIDENDHLFASVPETEAPMEEEQPGIAASGPVGKPSGPTPQRQDVSKVQLHSTAIGEELLRRAFREAGTGKEVDEAFVERASMDAARKLASRLRPNEMYALYLLWKLDGATYTSNQIEQITEVPQSSFAEVEQRAISCTPKLPGEKKGFFSRLFGR